MASYLRTRLPHFRHAALSLHKTKILPCFHSSNDAAALLPPRTAYVRAFHDDDKQDEIDDDGTLDSMKGNPAVLVKKGDDGGVLEPHAVVEKVGVTNSKLDAADDGGAQELRIEDFRSIGRASYDAHLKAIWDMYRAKCRERDEIDKQKKGQGGKTTKKRGKRVPKVVSLCNATSVYGIRTFPPEVLKDNRRLRQLFKAWMKEWDVKYDSMGVEMDKFGVFKLNVFRNDTKNRTLGGDYRLGFLADCIPGHHWICRRVLDYERSDEPKGSGQDSTNSTN